MEDCVINCGGPIEEPEETTLSVQTTSGTEAVLASGLTEAASGAEAVAAALVSVHTELPEEATSDLSEQQSDSLGKSSRKSLGAAPPLPTTTPAAEVAGDLEQLFKYSTVRHRYLAQYRLLFGFFLLYTDRVPFALPESTALL
jgi:hypothetical protein